MLEYQEIKDLSWIQSSDQSKFSSIKILDPSHKWFYRPYESDYPLIYQLMWPYTNMQIASIDNYITTIVILNNKMQPLNKSPQTINYSSRDVNLKIMRFVVRIKYIKFPWDQKLSQIKILDRQKKLWDSRETCESWHACPRYQQRTLLNRLQAQNKLTWGTHVCILVELGTRSALIISPSLKNHANITLRTPMLWTLTPWPLVDITCS